MQPDVEVAWHGAKWRDDRVDVSAPSVITTPQGLSPAKRPHARRGGRKPVISPAVAETMRTAAKPLSAVEVFTRIRARLGKTICTVAGVNSALYRLLKDGKIERGERRAGWGQFGCTYQWKEQPNAALDAVKLQARKAEIGRLGGFKSGEARRKAASC